MIEIRGARTNNLCNVSVDLPYERLTVITGVSGSGKSSLAFDTLFAEAQRQYIDSLSVYARQYVNPLPRPDLDSIRGLQPTLCIDQRPPALNPRSTVGTLTEIYDYLRLLFARLGTPHCVRCHRVIQQQSTPEIVRALLSLPSQTRLMIMAPLVREQAGDHRSSMHSLQQAGLVRMRIDGQLFEVDSPPTLAPQSPHTIEAVIDRFLLREDTESRLREAVSMALRLSQGLVSLSYLLPESENDWQEQLYSTRFTCSDCNIGYAPIEPRTFSFNSPYGACPVCDGTGSMRSRDETPQPKKAAQDEDGDASDGDAMLQAECCSACQGTRLKPEALAVRIQDCNIADLSSMDIERLLPWFENLTWPEVTSPIAKPLQDNILHRLRFLHRVGVGYLTLQRTADSLSGGELQRTRLATSIGSGLIGVCYVLDEPSIGLHPRDNQRLIDALRDLQRQGNTLVVVEHDEAMIREADYLIDMGPGAGKLGGQVLAHGSPQHVQASPHSATATYLRGEQQASHPFNRPYRKQPMLELFGAAANNLKQIDVQFPLARLIGVTGVSGSGKSSLIQDCLLPAMANALGWPKRRSPPIERLEGAEQLQRMIAIDQRPIGRSPRSTPATYCGIFDEIRKVFASTRDAKQRGFTAQRFSFNAGTGRCATCQGQGRVRLEMSFLSDLFITCQECEGRRFNRQTLQVRYRDRSIADCLEMDVKTAADFFQNFVKIHRPLACLSQVGLDYLALGQPSTTVSGGEAQRIKLANELAKTDSGKTLYVLDEPTTGLHFEDVRRLIEVLQQLVEKGSTVIVIEHNLDVIRSCDYLIDLGPEGGSGGGQLLACGSPKEIASYPQSITGRWL